MANNYVELQIVIREPLLLMITTLPKNAFTGIESTAGFLGGKFSTEVESYYGLDWL